MKRLQKFLRLTLLSFAGAALMLVIPAAGAAEIDAGGALPSYEELPAQAPDEALLKPLAAKSLKGRFEERRTLPGFPNLKTVESTLSQIRRRRARGTSGLWPSSP